MHIVTVIVATESYLAPLTSALRRIRAAVDAGLRAGDDHTLVCVTDKKSEAKVTSMLKSFREKKVIAIDVTETGEHYKNERQIMIATLQSVGFDAARDLGCDLLWSVEADVLPPPNALLVSRQMLEFDSNYYDVAFVTYPSQGGGSFLGGHGSSRQPIAEDFLPEERKLGAWLEKAWRATKDRLDDPELSREAKDREGDRMQRLAKQIRKCPPQKNVFALNAKAWRRRGWLDNAWPGIGRGAVIPTDWTGLGCTLMSKRAAQLAHFDGYDGGGTQDLFLNWHRWHPAGLRFCCITHTVCDHVVRDTESPSGFSTLKSYHEQEGETRGHLRFRSTPFYPFT